MRIKPVLVSILLVAGLSAPTAAQMLPAAAPEQVGLSTPRVARIKAVMQDYVDRGRIAGVVAVVTRGGKTAMFDAYGRMDIERNLPMRKDVIVRLASMSKAVTSVAVMMLVEEGTIQLTEPVSRFLPAFKQTTVAVPPPPGAPGIGRFGTVPAKREITIRDLLTHTAGISYGQGNPAESQYKAAGLLGWYLGDQKDPITTIAERLAGLPFDAQPGDKFVYGFNTDILGAVVEKASGMRLDRFFQTRIFDPLKMVDSGFFLPPEKKDRLATVYSAKADGLVRAPEPGMGQGDYVEGPRVCFSGGAGLLSTPTDYTRFLQMLLNGGELDGVRILGPKTIELMTSNHVGTLYSDTGTGFGLGFEVVEQVGKSGRYGSAGAYGWGSAYYQRYLIDPHEKLVAVFFAQLIPSGGLDLDAKYRTLVYQSIVGPVPADAALKPAPKTAAGAR
ncbi:MAG: serine hydrolase domain-containing protein [Acidobacteriota bacterium]